MKRKMRWGLFFGLGLPAFLLLVGLLVFLSTMKGSAPYVFMKDARQDGYWAPIISGDPVVSRFYVIDRPFAIVLNDATKELTEVKGWKRLNIDGTGEVILSNSYVDVLITPLANGTSVVIKRDADKSEELIGTFYESIPERFESWR
jgi:hypothetical protein